MQKKFNTTGVCIPEEHYMLNIDSRMAQIKKLIDEVDSASDNQVFIDFLAQLRAQYMDRFTQPSFKSVILAGVYDIKNLRRKIRSNDEHKYNSPWNIAADFNVEMSFSQEDIAGMLADYEQDHHTGRDIKICRDCYTAIHQVIRFWCQDYASL